MKHLLKFLFISLLATFVLVSCDKDEDVVEEEQTGDFSPLTVEQNKANLENTGIDLLNEAKALENTEAVNTTGSFVNFADQSNPFAGNPEMKSCGAEP